MKHLLKVAFTLIAATLFMTASAQNEAFIKYDLGGKTILVSGDEDLGCYNLFQPGDEEDKEHMDHAFYVASKVPYQLNIHIRTPPYTNPVAGKLPYVAIGYKTNDPCPAAYLSMIKMVGNKNEYYSSKPSKKGYFEITKVADGWVEGIFALDIPESFSSDYKGALHITNGSFRFKIAAEWKN